MTNANAPDGRSQCPFPQTTKAGGSFSSKLPHLALLQAAVSNEILLFPVHAPDRLSLQVTLKRLEYLTKLAGEEHDEVLPALQKALRLVPDDGPLISGGGGVGDTSGIAQLLRRMQTSAPNSTPVVPAVLRPETLQKLADYWETWGLEGM